MKAERENNIIAKIYDAALLPALWLEVIQDIVQYTQSHSAILPVLINLILPMTLFIPTISRKKVWLLIRMNGFGSLI